MSILNLDNPIDTPEKIKKLVPTKYLIECGKSSDGSETVTLAIIKIKHISVRLTNNELILSDNQIKERILNPMINAIEKTQ